MCLRTHDGSMPMCFSNSYDDMLMCLSKSQHAGCVCRTHKIMIASRCVIASHVATMILSFVSHASCEHRTHIRHIVKIVHTSCMHLVSIVHTSCMQCVHTRRAHLIHVSIPNEDFGRVNKRCLGGVECTHPKRRCWKAWPTFANAFSKHFSTIRSPNRVLKPLKSAWKKHSERLSLPNEDLGGMKKDKLRIFEAFFHGL